MKKSTKISMGILAFLPLILLLSYFAFFVGIFIELFSMAESANNNQLTSTAPEHLFSRYMIGVIVLMGLMLLSSLTLLIVYIIHIMNNPKLKQNTTLQLIWALVVLFGSFIGAIVYFIIEIYPTASQKDHIEEKSPTTSIS
ncbi:MAG: PLDc N-terminal domain-containing protein [Dokdonia sp.]|jgi:hypothetical protein|nr:hypothetical protein [Cytophagaceae bacterium]|tara:strand:+ start:1109 stop:1531 length:423 start_codon:yes stop_codon:yes gene_type:complete